MTFKTTLINVEELAVLAPDDVLIVDCRFDLMAPGSGERDVGKGERDYREGHIPGAVYASLDTDLSDLSRKAEGLGRHPLPLENAFSDVLSRWGWRDGTQIVCYDAANGSLAAARLWWLLKLAGIRDVAVLDGGYQAWVAVGKPVESGDVHRTSRPISLHFDTSRYIVDHASLRNDAHRMLIDARATPRYRGEVEPIDPVGGHVPGAFSRPFSENLRVDGRFKQAAELRKEFEALLGTHAPQDVVHMCGSGVTACHNLLAMEHAGLSGARLYAPSWSGWVSDANRPVAKGAEPG
ncbi:MULTISPECIES: sulfurtransferase [unclassified Dyella]|uniref:sulfurtransferase n=1 Tax=unclassified Dyella TaxID=2634549 RepID=UPI000C8684A8|nr:MULTISPECIES: sulfurtransferase [unclassified Dyella]MDR3445790.1 sulfurtransferase [Dyella sp.]PMQ04298.1 putative thiosulfate sulfurtransferase SseB [Dyella sp. AD56]